MPSTSDSSYRQKDLKHTLFLDAFIQKRWGFWSFLVPRYWKWIYADMWKENRAVFLNLPASCCDNDMLLLLSIFLMEQGTEFQNWLRSLLWKGHRPQLRIQPRVFKNCPCSSFMQNQQQQILQLLIMKNDSKRWGLTEQSEGLWGTPPVFIGVAWKRQHFSFALSKCVGDEADYPHEEFGTRLYIHHFS